MPRYKSASSDTMIIRVDTREQDPYAFHRMRDPSVRYSVTRGTLGTGDYDLDAFTALPSLQAIVERKSLADLYGTATRGRDRFERELGRMREYGYAAMVVEADMQTILNPNKSLRHPTLANPRSVLLSLLAWSQRFGVHIFCCPGRRAAEETTFRILERWWLDRMAEA